MSTVYLHIGTPKTGTTAIQQFLLLNRDELGRHGLCYPDFGFRYPGVGQYRNGHFLIATEAYDLIDRTDTEHGIFPKQARMDYEQGLSMLKECADTYDKIILTDEAIYNRSRKMEGDFYKTLKEDLAALGMQLKIIVYIRRQDLFVQSHWAQRVKMGSRNDFHEYLNSDFITDYPLDYFSYISSVADSIGRDSLIVRPYERNQFEGEGHTIQSDFLSVFGLKISDGFQLNDAPCNTRMEEEYLELQRVVNAFPEMQRLSKKNPFRHNVLRGSYFKPKEHRLFLEQYFASNSALAKEYLGREDGILFYDEVRPLPDYVLQEHGLSQDTAIVYGRAINSLVRRNERLEQELKDLRKQVNSSFFIRLERKIKKIFKSNN